MIRWLVTTVLCCGLALGATIARGQTANPDPHRPALAETLTGPAKEAYDSAKILLNNRDPAGAFTKYQQAYDLSKDPRLLFNMAICARDMRAYARMQKLLVLYEREARAGLSTEEKSDIEAALTTIRYLVGTVKLVINEPGAYVAVDGETVGASPLSDPLVVDLGKHALLVRKDGFEPVERSIEIFGGNETTVTIVLVAQQHTGRLTVVAEAGATVIVDKKQIGTGRFDGMLASGTHEVQVTAPGKKSFESLVDLREGETRSVQVSLVSDSHGSTIWPWIIGGAVVAAGATVGGYFLFRPHDENVYQKGTLDSTIHLPPNSGRP